MDGRKLRKKSPPRRKRAVLHPSLRKKYAERAKKAGFGKTKRTGTRTSRLGVPDGMRRAEAEALWAKARARAEELYDTMVDNGTMPALTDADFDRVVVEVEGKQTEVLVPKTDEGKAAVALKTAMVDVLSPLSDRGGRMAAIRTVLEYTKAKPTSKQDISITNAEDFLAKAIADNNGNDG